MRKGEKSILMVLLISAVLAGTALQSHAEYIVREVISMSPGDNQTREFYLSSILDLFGGNLAAEPYLIIATGDNETQCGKLTISLSSSPKKTFGSYMEYGLAGFAYGLGGTPEFINESVTTPWKIKKSVPLNAIFGFAYAGSFIKDITGEIELPAAFTITFKLAKKENK